MHMCNGDQETEYINHHQTMHPSIGVMRLYFDLCLAHFSYLYQYLVVIELELFV